MVIELLSQAGWGGARYAIDFIEQNLIDQAAKTEVQKPWCLLEASTSHLYLPSLSPFFRKAVAEGRLLWIRCSEDLAPALTQNILESGLCAGVLVRELDEFSRSAPAALWGRRWQLAAKRSGTHLLWVHHKTQAVIGFDLRLQWTRPQEFEIKKGHGLLKDGNLINGQRKKFFTHTPAA